MANTNYNILVGVEFAKGEVQKQLDTLVKKLDKKVPLDVSVPNGKEVASTMNNISDATKKASSAAEDLNLTFNVANEMFRTSIDLINSFVGQVRELDDAIVDFRKVSDLSGDSLDAYVQKLSKMGTKVARIGKLNQSEPVCTDGKCA